MSERVSIDGRAAVEVEIVDMKPRGWSTGPLPIAAVDVSRDDHRLAIEGGDRDGWETVAKHAIDRPDLQHVRLTFHEDFEPPEDGDPNVSGAQTVKDATERR